MSQVRCILALGAAFLALLALLALPAVSAAALPWSQSVQPLFASPFLEQSLTEGFDPQAESPPPPRAAVVSWYAALFHLSDSAAQTHLEVEGRGLHMPTLEASALGSRFGGVWFDNRAGKYYVGVPAGANLAAAEQLVSEMGMSEDTIFTPVRWSVPELEAANALITQEMSPLERVNEVAVGTNEAANEIQIILPTFDKPIDSEVAHRVAQEAAIKTVVIQRGPGVRRPHRMACATSFDRVNGFDDTFCNKPLRSAAGMDNDRNGTECSVGGAAFDGAATFVVTAGHCLVHELGDDWSTIEAATGKRHVIGHAERAVDGRPGDFGLIKEGYASESFWEEPNVRYTDLAGETPSYEMEGVVESFGGMYECWAGAQSNVHHHLGCGTVVATNVSENSTYHLDEAYGPPAGTGHALCLYDGDSGGPVISYHYLAGVISAGSDCSEREYAATYTPAPRIERYYGIKFVDALF